MLYCIPLIKYAKNTINKLEYYKIINKKNKQKEKKIKERRKKKEMTCRFPSECSIPRGCKCLDLNNYLTQIPLSSRVRCAPDLWLLDQCKQWNWPAVVGWWGLGLVREVPVVSLCTWCSLFRHCPKVAIVNRLNANLNRHPAHSHYPYLKAPHWQHRQPHSFYVHMFPPSV